jgi:diguanylate cyclase (GGDEF)-like protein
MHAAGFRRVRAVFARLSVRASLILLVLVVVAMLVADRGRDAFRVRGEAIARAQAELRAAAHDGASRQADLVAQAKAILRLASELPAAGADAGSACHASFKAIDDDTPWLSSLAVFGLDGFPLCSSAESVVRTSFADRAYFKEAVATGDFALSDYIIGRVTGQPIIVLAFPRMRDGATETVLIAAIDLAWMARIAAETGSTLDAEVLLLDKSATVLAGYPDPRTWTGRHLDDQPDFLAVLADPGDGIESADLDGKMRIIGHARLTDTDANLAVMLPLENVIADANRSALYAIGKILLAGMLCVSVIWLGGELLVLRPIRSLSKWAALLGSGDLDSRIPTEGLAPELKQLGHSFNEMATQLRARDAELRRANDRLATLASKDALTGIANRRSFDEQLAGEWRRTRRESAPLALLAIDVDHFKKFNDCYGHIEGDSCLKRVAKVFAASARRAGDFVARVGGEEFALILPGADLANAMEVAEALRQEVEALNIAHPQSPQTRITVSVGVAAVPPDWNERLATLVDRADAALYRAKRAGRNCVVSDGEPFALAS